MSEALCGLIVLDQKSKKHYSGCKDGAVNNGCQLDTLEMTICR